MLAELYGKFGIEAAFYCETMGWEMVYSENDVIDVWIVSAPGVKT